MATAIPDSTQILVIGGGPSGSYAATVLAREGFDVTLLEKDHFPRYHIGESMLPSCRPFLRFVEAEEKVKKHGFTVKPGAAVKLNQHKREGYTDFLAVHPENGSWNVIRSEFDDILLKHAAESGVKVIEGTPVTDISFACPSTSPQSPDNHPVAAKYKNTSSGETGSINFKYLVDASGRNGIMSTKYLKNRKFNQSLKNIAFWGYWTGQSVYAPGTSRHNAPWFEALVDESGWAWFIPLHDGTVSVGIVLAEASSKAKKGSLSPGYPIEDLNAKHYVTQLQLAPGLQKLLKGATFKGQVKSAGDYSYSASTYAGPRFRMVGDAAAFIDPFFSSGVHLAFTGGLSAATTIASSIRGDCTEDAAIAYHTAKVGTSYTRFLLVVLGIYKQINHLAEPVLSDIDEDNFDRAFHFLRPIIQGATDADAGNVTGSELDATIAFCQHAVGAASPDMMRSVAERLGPDVLKADGEILTNEKIDELVGDDEEARIVLQKVNSRKAVMDINDFAKNFAGESLGGFVARVEKGKLGLVKV